MLLVKEGAHEAIEIEYAHQSPLPLPRNTPGTLPYQMREMWIDPSVQRAVNPTSIEDTLPQQAGQVKSWALSCECLFQQTRFSIN